MNNQALHEHVRALSEALKHNASTSAQTRESLASLQHDIEKFLHAQGDSSLTDRLEKLAVRFETDHPAVGSALRQAIDALAKAGM